MTRIGERLSATAPRLIRIPAASSALWQDTRFIDAATAMVVDNNLSHLAHESCRHLGSVLGPGALTHTPAIVASGWDGYEDAEAFRNPKTNAIDPPAINGPLATAIAWDDRTAVNFGPAIGVRDRESPDGRGLDVLRRVFVEAHVVAPTPSGSSGLYLYAAITTDPAPPSENNTIALAVGAGTLLAQLPVPAGERVVTLYLNALSETGLTLGVRGRASGALGPVAQRICAYWVWCGWRSSLSGASVIAVSAYEGRD